MPQNKNHFFKKYNAFSIIIAFGMGLFCQYFMRLKINPSPVIEVNSCAIKTCFTPNQTCLPMIIQSLDNAKHSIHMQAYSFTSKPIAQALLRAQKRGVSITIIVDKSQKTANHSKVKTLHQVGIPIFIDHHVAIAHNKLIIIDKRIIIGGSYNFSNAAEERNAENVSIITSKELAEKYLTNFKTRLKESEKY